MFIYFIYVFPATMCPSSGEITVSMRHLVFVTQCGWLSGMQGGPCVQNNKYQVSHRYSYFSWWWARSRRKYVQKINKHTKKNCAQSWLYLQNYTGMHSQQNTKYTANVCCIYTLRSEWMPFKHTGMSRCDSSSSLLFLFKPSADKLCSMIIKFAALLYNTT